jgi:hypothetical protein
MREGGSKKADRGTAQGSTARERDGGIPQAPRLHQKTGEFFPGRLKG